MYKKLKVVTVANNKGGVAKSTICREIAEGLALMFGYKVLLIDSDPQCNLSECFLNMRQIPGSQKEGKIPPQHPDYEPGDPDWRFEYTSLADVLFEQAADWYPTDVETLKILPAESGRLEHDEMKRIADLVGEAQVSRQLRDWLAVAVDGDDTFDIVIIDTPPTKGPLTHSAIKAATHVLIPAEMERFAVTGLQGMFNMISHENSGRDQDDKLQIIGILPTKVMKQSVDHNKYLNALQDSPGTQKYMTGHIMHNWSGYKMSSNPGLDNSVFKLPPSDKVRVEATALVEHIKEVLFNG